jgi:hypothetical protein
MGYPGVLGLLKLIVYDIYGWGMVIVVKKRPKIVQKMRKLGQEGMKGDIKWLLACVAGIGR